MASKTDEDKIRSEDSGSDDGAELNKQRLRYEEAESKAIDEDWEHLAATDTASDSVWYIPRLSNYGSTSLEIGDSFKPKSARCVRRAVDAVGR